MTPLGLDCYEIKSTRRYSELAHEFIEISGIEETICGMYVYFFRYHCCCVFQDELTSRVMEQLRKKDRDSLLAEIQELRKTSTMKPLIDQVRLAWQLSTLSPGKVSRFALVLKLFRLCKFVAVRRIFVLVFHFFSSSLTLR